MAGRNVSFNQWLTNDSDDDARLLRQVYDRVYHAEQGERDALDLATHALKALHSVGALPQLVDLVAGQIAVARGRSYSIRKQMEHGPLVAFTASDLEQLDRFRAEFKSVEFPTGRADLLAMNVVYLAEAIADDDPVLTRLVRRALDAQRFKLLFTIDKAELTERFLATAVSPTDPVWVSVGSLFE